LLVGTYMNVLHIAVIWMCCICNSTSVCVCVCVCVCVWFRGHLYEYLKYSTDVSVFDVALIWMCVRADRPSVTHTHAYKHAHTHTQAHTHTHTRIHTRIHAHAHAHDLIGLFPTERAKRDLEHRLRFEIEEMTLLTTCAVPRITSIFWFQKKCIPLK